MNESIASTLRDEAVAFAARLQQAWNDGNATAFADEFTPNADFVNVRGDYAAGREAIAGGHAHIFSTIYAGSTIRYAVARVRELAPGVLHVHLDAHLVVPSGPLAGEIDAIPSLVLVEHDGSWKVAAFHNTQRAGSH
jgi:uncharacterized protein (TIGR02246 family)